VYGDDALGLTSTRCGGSSTSRVSVRAPARAPSSPDGTRHLGGTGQDVHVLGL